MPKIVNPEYLNAVKKKEIELKGTDKLNEWLTLTETTKKPRKATITQCQTLLILLYYLGCRPAELIDLKPKDIIKKTFPKTPDSPSQKAYEITIKTLKKGTPLRALNIPDNKYTRLAYKSIKKQHPEQDYFHAFRSRKGGARNLTKWKTTKKIMVKENGEMHEETITEQKERLYFKQSVLINSYITRLTGLPPYFFRHHRQTWMDEKGASIQEQADWKGGTIKSAMIYRASTGVKKKKQLKYF